MEKLINLAQLKWTAAQAAEDFRDVGAAQVPGVVHHDLLRGLLEPWLDELTRVAVRDVRLDSIRDDDLIMGGRYRRVDVGHPLVDSGRSAEMVGVLRRSGIEGQADVLAATVLPTVRVVTGTAVEFVRMQLLLYEEGDYIGPHTDQRSGDRYNVQLPVNWHGASGLRIFQRSGQQVLHDEPGVLRFLGPYVWHEVLPILRDSSDRKPRRAVLSLRFEPSDQPRRS